MATQLDRAGAAARADDVLDNAGPLGAIAPQVARLDRRYRELAAAIAPALDRRYPARSSRQNVASAESPAALP